MALTANPTMALETLKIALPADGMPSSAPIYVARDKGFFKELGLEIDIAIYRGGSAAQEALVAGAADLANPSLAGVAVAIRKGVKQKCVSGANGNEAGWFLLVKKDSPIQSPKELAGKRIGISARASNTDYFSLWTQKEGGFKADAIPLGTMGAQIGALKSGQVAAVPVSPPSSWHLVKTGDARVLTDYGTAMPPFYTGCWAALDATIAKKGDQIVNYFKAYLKGIEAMRADKPAAMNFLKTFAEVADPEILDVYYEQLIKGPIIEDGIRVKYVERSLELAVLSGVPAADVPGVREIMTDKFFPYIEN
jgi:NitT/TauT family transport system substrate-binding protein